MSESAKDKGIEFSPRFDEREEPEKDHGHTTARESVHLQKAGPDAPPAGGQVSPVDGDSETHSARPRASTAVGSAAEVIASVKARLGAAHRILVDRYASFERRNEGDDRSHFYRDDNEIARTLRGAQFDLASALTMIGSVSDSSQAIQEKNDHGAELAAAANDTGSSPTETASVPDAWHVDADFKEGGWFDEEMALSQLLADGVLFPNSFKIVRDAYDHTNPDGTVVRVRRYESEKETVALFVSMSDWFGWACADSEEFTLEDLPVLYRAWRNDKKWGVGKWACLHRGCPPIEPHIVGMKRDGVWDDALESLLAATKATTEVSSAPAASPAQEEKSSTFASGEAIERRQEEE